MIDGILADVGLLLSSRFVDFLDEFKMFFFDAGVRILFFGFLQTGVFSSEFVAAISPFVWRTFTILGITVDSDCSLCFLFLACALRSPASLTYGENRKYKLKRIVVYG